MGDSQELLELVFAHPHRAVTQARAILAESPSAFDASVAHHVIGLAQREYGDLDTAITELRRARQFARRSGSAQRLADVLATLGIAVVHAGQTRGGLAVLNQALAHATGVPAARVRFLRGCAWWILGRYREALADLRVAIPVLRRAGDVLWTARALTFRGLIRLAQGSVWRADNDLAAAESMFAAIGEQHACAVAQHNRGLVAFRSGDLPGALKCFAEVELRYRELGTPMPDLAIDRCAVLLAAGLAAEAVAEAEAALRTVAAQRGQATRRAELQLVAARAALAAGDPALAEERAATAAASFADQRRDWWHAHARLLLLQARFAGRPSSGKLLSQALRVAGQLDALGSPEAVQAHLLAGRLAIAQNASTTPLAVAARSRHRGPAISRIDGWLAQALLADAHGDGRGMLAACRRGLDVLDEHRLTLGASELRARSTARGAQLAELAQRASANDPRRLLHWSERWRATACALPPVRPPDDPALQRDLAALREITSRLQLARERGTPAQTLESERHRLERRVRERTLHAHGRAGAIGRLDVGVLLDTLGPGRLLELVDLDGELHVLACGDGRVRRWRAGRTASATSAIEAARFTLRLLAARRRDLERLQARLDDLGRRLEDVLLGPAARQLGEGPLVIVPPARLHGVPWALLPSLAERAHVVAPSAQAWLTSRAAPRGPDDVVLVRGPGLASQGGEVDELSRLYPSAQLLENGSATADQVLDSLDGVGLAHIAAHGTFRADNPLFSAVQLDDGPLTVYDFERLRRAPHRIVLPVCSSGGLLSVGADELLGLTAALLPLGTAGIVASMVPINDAATVSMMLALHASLHSGATCSQALHEARQALPDDPVHRGTAASFVALGAG